jgi:tetratricopeptide (TPR) repeat protein
VSARTYGRLERADLFVRRHRVGVGVATLSLLLLGGGLIGTTAGFLRARREASNATRASEIAKQETARYRDQLAANVAVARFLTSDLITVATPAGMGSDAKLVDLIARVEKLLPARFAGQPRLEAELQLALGEMNTQLGRYGAAVEMLGRSRELFESFDASDPRLARVYASLSVAQIELKRFDDAAASANRSLAFGGSDEPDDSAHAVARVSLAWVGDRKRNFDEALKQVDAAEKLLLPWKDRPGDQPQWVVVLNCRAMILDHANRFDEAAAAFERVMNESEQLLGPGHAFATLAAVNFATDLLDRNQPKKALPILEKAVPMLRQAYGEKNAYTLTAMGSLVSATSLCGDSQKALPLAIELEKLTADALGPASEESCYAANRVAVMYLRTKAEPAKTVAAATRATDIATKALGERHPQTATSFFTLAFAREANGELPEAIAACERAAAIYARITGDRDPRRVQVIDKLAKLRAATRPAS